MHLSLLVHRRALAPSALVAIDGTPSALLDGAARLPESEAGVESEAVVESETSLESEAGVE